MREHDWKYSDGTKLLGNVILPNGLDVDAGELQEPISDEVYFIVQISVLSVKASMMNHNAPQFVQ